MSKKREHSDVSQEEFSNEEIMSIVEEIYADASSEKEKKKKFQRKYGEFSERHETLFNMACRPNFEISKLRYMLALRSQIDNNTTTLEKASNRVGTALFNEYVKPIVDSTPPDKK